MLYPWSLGQWAGPDFGADLNAGGNAQLFGGDGALIGETTDGYTGWNIALAPQALKFDVVDKNTTDNWATVGDTVQTDTSGLPITQDLSYYIQWVDKNGEVVKTCKTAKADAATKIPSCPLKVPANAQTGDTFTARLKLTHGDLDPANDLVLALDAFAVANYYLAYDEVQAKSGEATSSEPKFDNPDTDAKETKPEKAKFELGTLPEGVTKDQVSVDSATGVVTFTPNADQVGKTFKFPVVMRNEDLRVPVLDENGDPVKGDDGQPKTQGRIVARADAPFKVANTTAATVEPAYEGKLVVPGKKTESAPSFTDQGGKSVDVP
ncbi:MAG: Rib/alpha-like domain-containing protein, partial [Schaalia turicensis]|nr:Rib/alpha-like domain-containing protein [Schaalia turicensis]